MTLRIVSFFIVLLLSNCVSFKSVEEVGKIGKTLGSFKAANEDAVWLCNTLKKSSDLNAISCDGLEKGTQKLNAGISILVAYNSALLAVIKDGDVALGDLVVNGIKLSNTLKWTTLTDTNIEGATALSKGVQGLFTNGIKRKALRDTIPALDPAIQQICTAMLAQSALHRQTYENYLAHVQSVSDADLAFRKQLQPAVSPGELEKTGIMNEVALLARRYTREQTDQLDQLDKTIRAYQKAHHVLAAQSMGIGRSKHEAAIAKEIVNSLKDIIGGIDKFKTPKETTSESTTSIN